MHGDEPDNAQEVVDRATGKRGYGPPIPPARIVADYRKLKAADPTRPIMLNLGQGVANDQWVGRGPGASLDDYPAVRAGLRHRVVRRLSRCGPRPQGRRRPALVRAQGGGPARSSGPAAASRSGTASSVLISAIPRAKATPHQVKAEVWMSLIHGSRGLIYFVHQFQPRFNEHALLDDPEMLAAVSAINHQIHDLAPVLNSPDVPGSRVGPLGQGGGPDRHPDQAAREDHLCLRRRDEERTHPRHVRDQGIEPRNRRRKCWAKSDASRSARAASRTTSSRTTCISTRSLRNEPTTKCDEPFPKTFRRCSG